jgi:hypothetical protein
VSTVAFTDQAGRIRRTVEHAFTGASFDSSRQEEAGVFVIEARRSDGSKVGVRFRGVQSSNAAAAEAASGALKVKGVSNPGRRGGVLGIFFPGMRGHGIGAVRVRIEAGAAQLEIVCQDAEWWEEPAAGGSGA